MCFAAIATGYYSATFKIPGGSAVALGHVDTVWELKSTPEFEDRTVDQWGKTIVGGVYLGQNHALAVTFKETNARVLDVIYPFSVNTASSNAASPGLAGQSGIIGKCMEDYAGELVLTAEDYGAADANSTPARVLGPWVITATKALAVGEMTIPFGNKDRLYAVMFRLYPTVANEVLTWFTMVGDGSSNANFPAS